MPNTFFDDDEPIEPGEEHQELTPDFFTTERPEEAGQLHFYYIDIDGNWMPYANFDFRPDAVRNDDGTPLIIMDEGIEHVVNMKTGELIPFERWDNQYDYYEIVGDMFDDVDEYDSIVSGNIGYSIT